MKYIDFSEWNYKKSDEDYIIFTDKKGSDEYFFRYISYEYVNALFVLPNINFNSIKKSYYKDRFALGFLLHQDVYSLDAKKEYINYIQRNKYRVHTIANCLKIKGALEKFQEIGINLDDEVIKKASKILAFKCAKYRVLFSSIEKIKEVLPFLHKEYYDCILALACMYRDNDVVNTLLEHNIHFILSTSQDQLKNHYNTYKIKEIIFNPYKGCSRYEDLIKKIQVKDNKEALAYYKSYCFQNLMLNYDFIHLSHFCVKHIDEILNLLEDGYLKANDKNTLYKNYLSLVKKKAIKVTDVFLVNAVIYKHLDIVKELCVYKELFPFLNECFFGNVQLYKYRDSLIKLFFSNDNIDFVKEFLKISKPYLNPFVLTDSVVNSIVALKFKGVYFRDIYPYFNLSKVSVYPFIEKMVKQGDEYYIIAFIENNYVNTNLRFNKLFKLATSYDFKVAKAYLLEFKNKLNKDHNISTSNIKKSVKLSL